MIKAIFFDMDGTLSVYDEEGNGGIPASAREAIDDLRERGVMIFAATGRGRQEMEDSELFRDMTFDAVLSMNGQYCYTDEEELRVAAIDGADLGYFGAFQRETPFPAIFMEKRRMYVNFSTPRFEAALAKISAVPPPAEEIENWEDREILQIVPYSDPAVIDRLMIGMEHSKATRWSPEFVDIVAKDGGKDKGIDLILDRFGLGEEEIMAFGDGENDIAMVKKAKIGVAMGNGADALKKAADEITDTALNDGVAKALRRFDEKGYFPR